MKNSLSKSDRLLPDTLRIDSRANNASIQLQNFLLQQFKKIKDKPGDVVIICIGSDRATGDALGPLIGEYLKSCALNTLIFGHLDKPVHAVNLEDYLTYIKQHHRLSPVLAIDASLGKPEEVGCVEAGSGKIEPGKGVKKELPPVGDVFIRGVVNVGGIMENLVLQSTRLSLVMHMSSVIGRGIAGTLDMYNSKQSFSGDNKMPASSERHSV